jgi:uncharacterized protein YbjT (DUF2867 family)
MNVIIAGSTGMVGRGVLYECIDDPQITGILLLNRKHIDVKHPKIREVLLSDLFSLDGIRNELSGLDACFFCLGVTSVGASEAEYTKLMYDLPVHMAQTLLALNPGMVFCFVSGAGTDGEEKSSSAMWARVKGKAENAILRMGFRDAYVFRPGFIIPKRGIRSRTGWYNFTYVFVRPFNFILVRFPKYVTTTVMLGKAMINVAKRGYGKKVLESVDINRVGSSSLSSER